MVSEPSAHDQGNARNYTDFAVIFERMLGSASLFVVSRVSDQPSSTPPRPHQANKPASQQANKHQDGGTETSQYWDVNVTGTGGSANSSLRASYVPPRIAYQIESEGFGIRTFPQGSDNKCRHWNCPPGRPLFPASCVVGVGPMIPAIQMR
ncbi:uncharacterized protein EI97DRAFT_324510 [Westerdykella ornata]|uniref:Uncharacterized protein n=1 Tax=Westerdykella ornata TaxID=318751 RepID=A0A6A6JLR2_WESOR|nr:uncharacterized protein EI97DRAFT_324510 [Westerdykella ornata]KAF2276888.1 hypothetical protein EI97DRAFT_324510 [Westerdykella ornata]